MAEKRLRILLVILAVFGILFIAGCEKAVEEPPPASDVRAMDLPGDDGTTAIIQWRHYAASPAQRYEVLRGESESEIEEVIAEISAQISIPAIDTSNLNNFADKDFYLVLDESTDPPTGHVIEATAETKDSIAKIGEHIEKVELSVVPSEFDELPVKFINADVYRVKPVEKMLEEAQLKKLADMALSDSGNSLVPSDMDNTLSLKISNREKTFIENGRVLRDLQGPNEDLIRKYGLGVYAIVTKDARYATKFNSMQAMDNDTSHAIEPGKKYYYKVRSYSKSDEGVDSKVVDVTPTNDEPAPPQIAGAMYDRVSGDLIVNWQTRDRDLTEIKLWATTAEDTLAMSGKEIASVNASWNSVKVEDAVKDSLQMFYLSVSDGVTETKSCLFQATPAEFGDVSIPSDLRLLDHPNDEGLALDLFWEPPAIDLNFDIAAKTHEKVSNDVKDNLYFYEGQVVEFTDSVPDDAQKILAYITTKEGDTFDLTVRYDIMANTTHNAAFATISLKGHGLDITETDYDEMGKVEFTDLSADEYTITAVLKNANGFEYDNPESKIEKQITIAHSGTQEHAPDQRMYQIYRAMADDGAPDKSEFELYRMASGSQREYVDRWTKDEEGQYREATSHKYAYFLRAMGQDGNFIDSDILGPMKPKSNIFHTKKTIVALFIALFLIFAGYYMVQGRRGKEYFIRPIAGITHIDEALGRATEMGKPILYVMGLGSLGDLPTLASMTILGRVAKKAAEYQNRLIVPAADPIVMLVAQETVRSAYIDAGRPDAYNENDIYFITRSQFSYAAAVSGIMMREKTATHFFMGWFAAESLILSEAGAMTGAIQISGTDAVSQLPFFITSCDYTLMGEELYAASAYMSGDPIQISGLKIQDSLKAIYALLMVLGTIALSTNILWFVNLFKVNLEQ